MPATTLWLARHGALERAGELFYGHHDLALSARGVAEASAVAERLASVPLCAVYASDLSRARVFAEIVAARHALPVVTLPALREMALGVLEGVSLADAQAQYPELAARPIEDMTDFRFPGGGESMRDVAARALPVFEELFARHRGEAFFVCAHNSVNRILLADVMGVPIEKLFTFGQGHGALNVVRHGRRGREVVALNELPAVARGRVVARAIVPSRVSSADVPTSVAGARYAIRVPAIRFEGRHGWHAREREHARPFKVELYIEADLGHAAATDQLGDTVDYRVLAQRVVKLGSERSFKLIEALGAAIADDLLANVSALTRVEVSVFKPVTLAGEVREVEAIVVRERGAA